MTTSRAHTFRISLYPLITIAAFGLIASACSSSGETSEASETDQVNETSQTNETNETATAEVTVEGEALPPMADGSEDPAIGQTAPEIKGTDMSGEPMSITADGRAKAIYFIAHWCTHCQDEVPVLTELINTDQQPANLDIYAISTAVDESQANFPPSEWLATEEFPAPTIRDNADNEALLAYGAGGFPYVVYLDADNKVVNRTAGQLGSEEIVELWTQTAS